MSSNIEAHYLPYWETYLYKCLRELTLADRAKRYKLKLDDVLEIADVFATSRKIEPRVKELQKLIRRLG